MKIGFQFDDGGFGRQFNYGYGFAYAICPSKWQNKCSYECIIHIHLQFTDLFYFDFLFIHFFFQIWLFFAYKCNDFDWPAAHRHINPQYFFSSYYCYYYLLPLFLFYFCCSTMNPMLFKLKLDDRQLLVKKFNCLLQKVSVNRRRSYRLLWMFMLTFLFFFSSHSILLRLHQF